MAALGYRLLEGMDGVQGLQGLKGEGVGDVVGEEVGVGERVGVGVGEGVGVNRGLRRVLTDLQNRHDAMGILELLETLQGGV